MKKFPFFAAHTEKTVLKVASFIPSAYMCHVLDGVKPNTLKEKHFDALLESILSLTPAPLTAQIQSAAESIIAGDI